MVAAIDLTIASAFSQGQVLDGFESPALAAHWTITQQSGSVATSVAFPHTGIRSAEFATTVSAQNKLVALSLTLPTAKYGRFSVWMKDTAASLSSSNYIALTASNTASGSFTDILTFDYNLGPGQGGDVYYFRPWNTSSQPIPSGLSRTNAWHFWEIDSLPGSSAIRVDGLTLAASSQSMPIDSIALTLFGPSWRPAHTTYFDDFAFVPSVPASLSIPYGDGFENATLNPRWTFTQQSGSVATSVAFPHTGTRSAEFATTVSAQDKLVALSLTLPTAKYGRFSVWMKDTAASLSSSNYIALTASNTASGSFTDILTFDYNLGPGQGGDVYYFRPWNTSSQPIPSSLSRTNAWHFWEIDSLPGSFAIRVDGLTLAASSQSMPIDSIALTLFGPSWRPAHTTYFDDFSFVATIGTGCALGMPPVLSAGTPVLGSALQFDLRGARPNAPVVFAVAPGGPTATQVGSCDVQVDLAAASLSLIGSTTASGTWNHSLHIPQVASLVGFELTAQGLVLGNGGPMLGLGDLSTATAVQIAF